MKFTQKPFTFKNLLIHLLIMSGVIALLTDFIYGSRSLAEEHMFGAWLSVISTFGLTLSTIIALVWVVFLLIFNKLNPLILSKINFVDEQPKPEKRSKKLNKK